MSQVKPSPPIIYPPDGTLTRCNYITHALFMGASDHMHFFWLEADGHLPSANVAFECVCLGEEF